MTRMTVAFGAMVLAFGAGAAVGQQNNGPSTAPLGGFRAPSNNPGAGSGEMPGSFAGVTNQHRAKGEVKGQYGLDLARRIAEAQRLVDATNHGRVLTDSDTRHIRDLMREDFFAWRKQYDLMPDPYRAERDRWLLDPGALSPNAWAKQRLDWLEAQRDWILARGG